MGTKFFLGDNENVIKLVIEVAQPCEHIKMTALSKLEIDFIIFGLYASKTSIYKNQAVSSRF